MTTIVMTSGAGTSVKDRLKVRNRELGEGSQLKSGLGVPRIGRWRDLMVKYSLFDLT